MIPVRLKLHNFMCYRDNVPELDFTGIHLACLSGDNGNGKSAIIDAMTWALWGKARAGSDDDLIHSTQNDMAVEFDFTVENQLYRILRKRTRPKRRNSPGQPSLEFQVSDSDGFRPVTGNTIAETQQKIISALHMDYDTFVNSAYLRQGHADEFTRQVPSRRKEVLGNILGLALYDELEERARDLVRHHESDTARLESSIKDIADEIALKPGYEAELVEAEQALSLLESDNREKEARRNILRQQKETLENRKSQLEELEKRLDTSARDLERWREQVKQLEARIAAYEELIDRRDSIEEGYDAFRKTKDAYEKLEQDFRKSVNLEKRKSQLEARIQQAGQGLTTEHAIVRKDIADIEAKMQQVPGLKQQLSEVQVKLNAAAETEATLQQKEESARELASRINHLEAEESRLKNDIAEIEEKLDLLVSHMESHDDVKCPLCETELTREGLELISGKYTTEKQQKTGALATVRSDLDEKRKELQALREDITKSQDACSREKTALQGRAGIITRDIADIEETRDQMAELKANLDDIEQRLAQKDFALAEQEALSAVEREVLDLDYDAALHEETRRRLAETEIFDNDKRRLDEAESQVDREREAVSRAAEAVKGLQSGIEEDGHKREAMSAELEQLPRVLSDLSVAENEYRDSAEKLSRAREKMGSIKSAIQRCNELELRKKEKEQQLAGISKEANIYKELARAFGKTGIQALLIEVALPEIENEANLLLGRMTDNRMHVKFETQQETKTGNVRETLAINIADELGTRNYEMFSGGEAFRINFAIRIALSRLLAKRAGARLPTLIIDEGFGTQDSTGMEKLKEVINSVQEDFDKILVVTHMEELKDAFPNRIDVVKGAGGSTISVN